MINNNFTDESESLKIALLSDIHGNRWALESVLNHMVQIGVQMWANLGDIFYGPLDPAGTYQIMKETNIVSICGNEDRILFEPGKQGSSPTFEYTVKSLGIDGLDWLTTLPPTMMLEKGLFLCHGTPQSDTDYLLEQVTAEGSRERSKNEVRNLLGDLEADVVACGHSHLPRFLRLDNGLVVLNPGSVGLPAYTDDLPYPHAMEAGTCHARYAVLTLAGDEWSGEFHQIEYDVKSAVSAALRNHRPDWAAWLEKGIAH
ncbi:metallophosphoesterase family protein [Candidatus Neomarinimicrobiota bacterium]